MFPLIFLLACESGPDYGAYGPLIRTQRETLAADPCNEKAVIELAGLFEKAIHSEEGLAAIRAYTAACTPTDQFEPFQLEYATSAQDWPMALGILDRRVEEAPSSARPRTHRADIREKAGDLAGAADDLRQAALVADRAARPQALKALATAEQKAGKPCDAWKTWKTLSETSRPLRGEAQLAAMKLLREPACQDLPVTATGKVKRQDLSGWWAFPVTLDGKATLMGADTSASTSVLARATATALGLVASGEPWFVKSFQGTVAGPMYRAAQLEVGGVVVREVDVVIVDVLPDGLPGMMGADLLSRIRLSEVSGATWKVEPNE